MSIRVAKIWNRLSRGEAESSLEVLKRRLDIIFWDSLDRNNPTLSRGLDYITT